MLKKITISLILFLLVSCTTEKSKTANQKEEVNKTEKQEFGEHKSIHQQEWEEHKDKSSDKHIGSTSLDVKIVSTETITDNVNKKFMLPRFTSDGKTIIFTTDNYNEIWTYDIEKKIINQFNSLPGSGYKFEISADGKKLYFRNKTFTKNNPKAQYTIVEQLIENKKMNILYISKNVLTPPVQIGNEIVFLENDNPKSYNLKTKKISENFTSTFISVVNNKLLKFTGNKVEEISLNGMKPISAKYTSDKKNIICLTATKGVLLLDENGTPVNNYPKAFSLSKLNNSNLVVFTEEEDDGKQIIKSEIYLGFTNSDKKIKLTNLEDEKVFNPAWSSTENKITYNTEDGKIKIITLKINLKEK
jgi:hypothetical protein